MISGFLDTIGSKATAIAIIYPVVVALYAVGFFWSLPNDLIGLFDIGAFLFKASIVYLSAISFLLLSFMLMALVYAPVMTRIEGEEDNSDEPMIREDETPWSKFSKRRKVLWSILAFAIIVGAGWVVSIDPPALRHGLDGFVLFFMLVLLGGTVLRPFISGETWTVGKVLFFGAFAFIVPILVGQSDAEPKDGAPTLSYEKQRCPIIYVTADLRVADCGPVIAVALEGSEDLLVWKKDI